MPNVTKKRGDYSIKKWNLIVKDTTTVSVLSFVKKIKIVSVDETLKQIVFACFMDTVEFLICMEVKLIRSGYSVEWKSHTWCIKRISFSFSFAHNQCLVWLNKYKTSIDHRRQKSYALLIWQFRVIGSYFFRTSLDNTQINSTWVLLHELEVNILL